MRENGMRVWPDGGLRSRAGRVGGATLLALGFVALLGGFAFDWWRPAPRRAEPSRADRLPEPDAG